MVSPSYSSCAPSKVRGIRDFRHFKQNSSTASFQHGVLESRLTWMFPEASLRTWMPTIHTGMTHSVLSLLSMGERKIMEHFVPVC